MIPGKATPEGTAAFARKHAALPAGHWRQALGLTLGSVGLGTYLGNADPVTDAKYAAAAGRALGLGLNVVDTAINYRFQRSERSVGAALRQAVEAGAVAREQVLLCTKGGYLAGDAGPATREWFEETYLKPGLLTPGDVVGGGHCMTPAYLRHEVDQSRRNLGVETIDVYYLHNPETQAAEMGESDYAARLTEAFRTLEECADQGKIQWYGAATWSGFLSEAGDPSRLSLEQTVACAAAAGGAGHRFRVVQFPFNLGMQEAHAAATQTLQGQPATALEAARALGLTVFTSVPLLQGRLLGHPAFRRLKEKFPGLKTDAQRCLQFVRSTPGITAPLCGMKDVEHVEENARVTAVPPLTPEEYEALFEPA
jgi:aryl-alcohol dehydrogenase-like predicted oxidoreductase